VAPVHDVASPIAPVEVSSVALPSPSAETPPPATLAVQGTPFFSVQPAGIGGCGALFEEHASTAPRAAASGPSARFAPGDLPSI